MYIHICICIYIYVGGELMEPEVLIGEFDTLLLDSTGAKEGILYTFIFICGYLCMFRCFYVYLSICIYAYLWARTLVGEFDTLLLDNTALVQKKVNIAYIYVFLYGYSCIYLDIFMYIYVCLSVYRLKY
jgi:hypothetical protein